MKITPTLKDIFYSYLDTTHDFYYKNFESIFDSNKDMRKILSYDDDVAFITNNAIFIDITLVDSEIDKRFKKAFVMKFLNRQIQTQTLESFQAKVMQTYYMNEDFLIRYYTELDKYLHLTSYGDSSDESENVGNDTGENVTTSRNVTDSTSRSVSHTDNENRDSNESMTNNRSASSDLPQNRHNLNLNDDTMPTAKTNDISKQGQKGSSTQNGSSDSTNENTGNQVGTGENISNDKRNSQSTSKGNSRFQNQQMTLENLRQMRPMLSEVFDDFDRNCFLQVW